MDDFPKFQDAYSDWNDRTELIDTIARGEWEVVWPDYKRDRALPKIPNYVELAATHRARLLMESLPMVTARPDSLTDKAKNASEKRERMVYGWWQRSRLPSSLVRWALDLQYTGLSVCKVSTDLSCEPAEQFPLYSRIDPRSCYIGPAFANGPFVQDIIVAWEATANEVTWTYPAFKAEISDMMVRAKNQGMVKEGRVRVLEYYDKGQVLVTIEPLFSSKSGKTPPFVTVTDEQHGLGCVPFAIGTRPTHDGSYRGDFDNVLAMLNTSNRIMTMHLDSAALNVYPVRIVGQGIDNPEDYGPGAEIHSQEWPPQLDYLASPPSPYDGYQIMRVLDAAIRSAVLLPPSVTGDPNESVTSAAGIGATQSMPNAEVVSMQRDSLAPMLQAANEIAFRGEEQYGDVEKTISGVSRGTSFSETYVPSKDIKGNYQNDVVYGMGAGLDKVTLNVALLQNKGEGMISDRTAREKSPFVDDPLGEEKQIGIEQMTKAAFSALIASAAAPPGDPRAITPQQIADIWDEMEQPDGSLKEAIRKHMTPAQQPLAPVAETGSPALSSPGVAGVGEPQPPSFAGAPPIDELLGA
jgi:hypothetical protein